MSRQLALLTEVAGMKNVTVRTAKGSAWSPQVTKAAREIRKLRPDIPYEVLGKVFRLFAKKAPWLLWPAAKAIDDERAEVLDQALSVSKLVQANFLRAAFASGGAERLREAGTLLSYFERSTNVPGATKAFAKRWDEIDAAVMAPLAADALRLRAPKADELQAFYVFVYLVARHAPDHPVLAKLAGVKGANAGKVLDRTLAAAAKAR